MENAEDKKIVPGTRIACACREGTVYAIHGEPRADMLSPARGDRNLHGRKVDVVFDSGVVSHDVPEMVIRSGAWQIFDEVVPKQAMALALTVAACHAASTSAASAAQLAAFNAYNAEIARLRSAPEYHHLAQGDDTYSGRLAAKNIRASLSAAFPDVRFSVRRTPCGNIVVHWKDGPRAENVDAIVMRYRAGRYNRIAGSYEYTRTAWVAVFGAAKYIHVAREESDELVQSAIDSLYKKHRGSLIGIVKPGVAAYKGGALCHVDVPGFDASFQELLRLEIAGMSR